jgi:hypothetical protein
MSWILYGSLSSFKFLKARGCHRQSPWHKIISAESRKVDNTSGALMRMLDGPITKGKICHSFAQVLRQRR